MTISTVQFSRKILTKSTNGWEGTNLTSTAFGYDGIDGQAFGTGEYGGLEHFRNRTNTDIQR